MSDELIVRAAVAPMHGEPRVSSAQISQRLGGHAVQVVATDGDWVRARGEDGYEGWMHRGYLVPPAPGLTSTDRRLSLGVVVRDATGGPERALPLGAWLPADNVVVSGSVVDSSTRPAMFPHDPHAIAATAVQRFAGTPYQWGGVTPWGADCSGLVQTTFWLHGVNLPRDAWMQAERGAEVTGGVEAWQAADLAFFSDRPDRRVTHVGIALGDAHMVHLALGRGGYSVERLTDSGDPYVTSLIARLVTVRRVS
jgi:cell wall-associated NlpC family hydrolase